MNSASPKQISPYKKTEKRLLTRITKEFDKKFFIGDITVTDEEYEILIKQATTQLYSMIRNERPLADSPLLAVAMVQIGIRKYDGNFWSHASREFKIELSQRFRNYLGDTLINTLKHHNKFILNESERVQTTLFHGFVSNYYSKGLFELLFQYYSKDLERDIYRNDSQQMQALMDTLAKKATLGEKESEVFADQFMQKGSRAYKLRHHTLSAISAYPVHSRVRLRRLLRLIDNAFWKGQIPQNPVSRLTILFKEWVNESVAFRNEYSKYMLGEIKNKGKKHFSSPFLFADIRRTRFELRLPSQIVREPDVSLPHWEVITNKRIMRIPVDYSDALTGHKTFDTCCEISPDELFDTIKCQLFWGTTVVNRFSNLPSSEVRFFDLEGDYAPKLFKIQMCGYTKQGVSLASPALLKKVTLGPLTRWDFSFERGDVVILPNGGSLIVGDRYMEGLIPRGRVSGASYSDSKHIDVSIYAKIPDILVTLPANQKDETAITINGIRRKLRNIEHSQFGTDNRKNECTVLLQLDKIGLCKNHSLNSVIVNVPGSVHPQSYDFVLIDGFVPRFDGAPYVFEERGTVIFPKNVKVSCDDAEALQEENGLCFDLSTGISRLMITVDETLFLTLKIPVVSWSIDNENWSIEPIGDLWISEFNNIKKIFIRSPISKITFSTDTDIPDDDDEEAHIITAEYLDNDIYIANLQPFKKWLTRDIMKHSIDIMIGGTTYNFANIYTRSFVVSCDLSADYDTNELTCHCDIIGCSEYFLDIKHKSSGRIIAEKAPLKNNMLSIYDSLQNGLYAIDVFEAEFETEENETTFWPIHSFEKELTNKNDLSEKHFRLRSFKPRRLSNLYTLFSHEYWLTDLTRVNSYTYQCKLIDNGIESGLDVQIKFHDLNDLRYFSIAFWDDYDEMYTDFMFDAKMQKLVQEEAPGILASERYRRFRILYEDDYMYYGLLQDTIPVKE